MLRVLSLAFLLCVLPATAQESSILDSINAGDITGSSLIAIPQSNAAPGIPGTEDDIPAGASDDESTITDRAYPLMSAKWPFNQVFVCWENPSQEQFEQRASVREAIRDTWEANSGLRFLGWNACTENSVGIRISVQDTGPHVKYLGKYVDGVPSGMVLNFTYANWGQPCQEMLDYCNRVIAVHEFGHAIGFAHEQNRPDTPGECDDRQGNDGDTLLTPWDIHSVMNYCNPTYSNDGVLSEFDVKAVQYIYGLPS